MSREGNLFMVKYLMDAAEDFLEKLDSISDIIEDDSASDEIQDSCESLLFDMMHSFSRLPDEASIAYMENLNMRIAVSSGSHMTLRKFNQSETDEVEE